MTLRPALARLKRGFLRLWDWTRAKVTGARSYRYEGEKEAHAQQLRETEISLSLMANADPANPDQVRMASDIEDGFEKRLTVLLGKPQLSLAEKRERDAIQMAISARRQGFSAPATTPRRFFAAPALLGGFQPWMIWTGAVVLLLGGLGIQTGRLESAKANLREARAEAQQAHEAAESWRDRAGQYAQAVTDARETARMSAEALTAEREARARAARAERRRQREIQDVLANSPDAPAWSLRDDGTSTQ